MKRLKYLLLASLVAFAACDEDTEGPDTQTGSVRVTVTAGGSPLAGVTVSLGAAGTSPVTTGTDGVANFATVPVGTYTVTVTGLTADVVCSSTTQPVTVAAGQTTAVTFACNIVQTASIAGTVAFSNGDPRPNATVTITRTAPAPAGAAVNLTTNANGQYSLTGLRSGTYTVTLPVTAGCTTAANTQTIQLAAGEARVVNFTCTVAPPPDPTVPATVAIQSITFTGAGGQQIPMPTNQVFGVVNVNMGIEEGEQKVTRVRLRLGNTVVHDQTFVAAPVPEMELATFSIVAPVNTGVFNTTTGVPTFLNGNTNFVVDIFTVAGGSTTPVHTATLAITLANVDFIYATVAAERNALSTNTTAGTPLTVGTTWWGGDFTLTALPVMYSGLAVQNVTLAVRGFVPEDGADDLLNYYNGNGQNWTVGRIDSSTPYQAMLSADDDINDNDDDPFDSDNGIGEVEDAALEIQVNVLRQDGQAGPLFNNTGNPGATVCTGGVLANFVNYPLTGCADGQPAQPIRYDTNAPVAGQLDRIGRWSSSYAWMSREEPDAVLNGGVSPFYSGVTGWLHEAFTFGATRLVPDINDPDAAHSTQATQPRVADLGVGLPTSNYAIFRMGSATDQLQVVTTPASFTETFNNDVYYVNVTFQDVFGAAGETNNQRTRFYDTSYDGTGTSSGNLTAIQAAGSNARFGLDESDPCFSANGSTCDNLLLNGVRLTDDRDVIGVAGTLTIGNGGVMDGTQFVSQILDVQGPEGGTPSFFPVNPVITRVRRYQPNITTTAGCHVGQISNNACQFAGMVAGLSGTIGSFDWYDPMDNGQFWTQVNPLTGAVTNRNNDAAGISLDADNRTVAQNTGYYLVELRAVDQAGNQSALLTRTFVWDRTAPIVGGLSFAALLNPGAQGTFTTIVNDELDLDRAEFYLVWTGATLAILQNTTSIGEFGQATYTTAGTATHTGTFTHQLRVADGTLLPTTNSLFRVFDFGRNVGEATGGVPAVNNPPNEQGDITVASLYSNNAILCWDQDADGCTNPTSATLTFQVTGPTSVPFNRVDFLVGRDVNNDGVVDTDTNGNQLFAPITSGSAVSVVANVSTFTRTVTVQQIVAASQRSVIPGGGNTVTIRAIGYRPNGTAFTVTGAVVVCPNAAGSNAACTIQLAVD
jgi:hypothetical protein